MQQRALELARACGAPLEPDQAARLGAYADLVALWDATHNLTGARDPRALAEVLFVDALAVHGAGIVPPDAVLVDVGAGVGAPTIPLLLLREDARATLVEPRQKRVAFLRTALGSLGLVPRARVVVGSLDPRAPVVEGGPFDLALSRATFAPPIWASLGLRLAPRVLVFATDPDALALEGSLVIERTVRYELPSTRSPRAALLVAPRLSRPSADGAPS